ncbi:trypsin-like serine protease [Sphingomonas lutea]|uniref:Trypsin-like serine protease n=1 Tax=Sphingomonas lutea TaxID=1045317 RepID=A0A7G9SJ65_9SPHN|nr:trypsin-like serine protease [Sphingomonas lutea]QNN67890.1 trypsin-like serine protease [Sphingomonas lutea]
MIHKSARVALLAASSLASFAVATPALAADTQEWDRQAAFEALRALDPTATLDVVTNHEVPTGPANVLPGTVGANNGSIYSNSQQVLDAAGSINGIGQQIAFIQTGATTAGLSLCTGSLINPRAVITAAHCVYNNPAHRYGSNTGTGGGVSGNFGTGGAPLSSQGIPYSFGFESLNRNCFNAAGLPFTCPAGQKGAYETWRDANFQTVASRHIYNANQVWYGTGSQPVALGGSGEFANQDIAIVTLDTHAKGIPTWTLLFSPLDGPTHATITGYGGAGVGLSGIGNLAGIDYRRRSAENMIDALMSSADWGMSDAIGGGAAQFGALTHPIYWMDFDDPDFDPENLPANFFANVQPGPNPPRNNGYYDFNGLGGTALANEGTTAGGDSGGPLIVDERWDRPVIVGVLTGSWSFNGGIATYGSFSVYPPLFQFWEDIVQNNPYVYASAKAGNGDWFNQGHWVQDMDPNYAIIGSNGELLTGLPDTAQGGADGAVDRFGTVCFLGEDCNTFDGPATPTGNGTPVVTAGGPGSVNFVPNNVEPINSATPGSTIKARYYDVRLHRAGTTTLSQSATIDKLTVAGAGKLKITAPGTLNIWADYEQDGGWTQVDGKLNVGGDAIVKTGLVSGTGTIKSDFMTVVGGHVAPGAETRSVRSRLTAISSWLLPRRCT